MGSCGGCTRTYNGILTMDFPEGYSCAGYPLDLDAQQEERDGYVLAAADAEMGVGCDDGISVILGSRFYQELSTCIKLYTNPGKVAWYCKLLDGVSGPDDSTKNKMQMRKPYIFQEELGLAMDDRKGKS